MIRSTRSVHAPMSDLLSCLYRVCLLGFLLLEGVWSLILEFLSVFDQVIRHCFGHSKMLVSSLRIARETPSVVFDNRSIISGSCYTWYFRGLPLDTQIINLRRISSSSPTGAHFYELSWHDCQVMSPRLPKPWAMMMYNAKSMNNLEWERLDRFQASTLHCSCAYIYADHLGMYQTIHRLITATQVSCHAAWVRILQSRNC